MEDHVPEDWNPDPKLMSKIVDLNYALFAQDLNCNLVDFRDNFV